MDTASTKGHLRPNDNSPDQFRQQLVQYVRQVGQLYESDKAIQAAVKILEKSFNTAK
ncbi:hypothetical protein [Spirosoma agri]|uniref:Uncharacterized protein n=1 Tax=Spirosoma agri TaxID=1987381 RepID=A0A6M0IB55_9BACT|nr:hypothetical protein [Spirosoma agri]NEU65339.1 hypothetical protein [Spirosoma agri]